MSFIDTQGDDDGDVPVPVPSEELVRINGDLLPVTMLTRALGRRQRRFVEEKAICVVLRVKSASWAGPLSRAAKHIAKWHRIVRPDASSRTTVIEVTDALSRLTFGERVLFVVSDPAHLPQQAWSAVDFTVELDAIHASDIASTIKAVARGRTRDLSDLPVARLELPETMAAIRAGTTAASCIRRLRAALPRPAIDPLVSSAPALEALHGYGEAQEWGRRLVDDLRRWRAGELEFTAIQRRAVLAGLPGTGKSTYVRSLAKSAGVPLVTSSVGRMFATSAGYLDSIVKAIDRLFADARAAGDTCIVFLDELEAFPARESLDGRHASWWTPVVAHLLTTLDSGLSSEAAKLIVIGATNYPAKLDPALVRSGRLDRLIWIDPPDEKALAGIFRQYLGPDLAGQPLGGMAALAAGSTGADVAAFVLGARTRARAQGRSMTMQDLVDEVVPPSDMPEDHRWRACVHESGHAIAALVMGTGRLMSVSVGGKGRDGGGRVVLEGATNGIVVAEALRGFVVQALAGRAAEEVVLGTASGGAGGGPDSDLAKASSLIAAAHLSLGLRGTIIYGADPQDALSVARRTPGAMEIIGKEMNEHYRTAVNLVSAHSDAVLALARMISERRVVSGEVVRTMFEALRPDQKDADDA